MNVKIHIQLASIPQGWAKFNRKVNLGGYYGSECYKQRTIQKLLART